MLETSKLPNMNKRFLKNVELTNERPGKVKIFGKLARLLNNKTKTNWYHLLALFAFYCPIKHVYPNINFNVLELVRLKLK